jgi:predicted site-specific integrase-resolvase
MKQATMSLPAAAMALQISHTAAYREMLSGRLVGTQKANGRYEIDAASVARVKAEREAHAEAHQAA